MVIGSTMLRSAMARQRSPKGNTLGFFEPYVTVWVFLCIGLGIALGRLFPWVGTALDALSIY